MQSTMQQPGINSPLDRTMCFKTEVKKGFDRVCDWLKFVELGGAVLVTLALGIVFGEFATEDLQRINQILSIVATGSCVSLGLAVLYYTQFDRRRSRNALLLAVLATLGVANGLKLMDYLDPTVHDIMFALSSVFVILFLMVGAVQGRFHADLRRGGPDDRNQRRPRPK